MSETDGLFPAYSVLPAGSDLSLELSRTICYLVRLHTSHERPQEFSRGGGHFWVFQGFGVNTPKRTQNIILKQPKNPEKTPKHTFKTQEATTPITPPLTCGRTRFQTIFN